MATLKHYEFCSRFGAASMPLSSEAEKEVKSFFKSAEEHHQLQNSAYLAGDVYNRQGFEDGARIITSKVISLTRETGGIIAKTASGTKYALIEE